MYIKDINLRPSCFQCEFATSERPGDITLGDFWGIEKHYPEFADKYGVSAIITNTQKGEELFNASCNDFEFFKSSKDVLLKYQTQLSGTPPQSNVAIPPAREYFWKDYKNFGVKFAMQKQGFLPLSFSYKLARIIEVLSDKFKKHI